MESILIFLAGVVVTAACLVWLLQGRVRAALQQGRAELEPELAALHERLKARDEEQGRLRTQLDAKQDELETARARVTLLMDDNAAIRDRLARLEQLLGKQ